MFKKYCAASLSERKLINNCGSSVSDNQTFKHFYCAYTKQAKMEQAKCKENCKSWVSLYSKLENPLLFGSNVS